MVISRIRLIANIPNLRTINKSICGAARNKQANVLNVARMRSICIDILLKGAILPLCTASNINVMKHPNTNAKNSAPLIIYNFTCKPDVVLDVVLVGIVVLVHIFF